MPPSTNVNEYKANLSPTHTPNGLTHLTSGKYHGHGPDTMKQVTMKAMEALAVLGGKPNFLLFFPNTCFRELQTEKLCWG